MSQNEFVESRHKRAYEPPTVTRVHVDPVKELLQATACAFAANQNPTCNANPGT